MADQWDEAAKQYTASTTPVAAKPSGANDDWKIWGQSQQQSNEFHPMDSVLHAAKDYWEQINPVSKIQGIQQAVTHPLDTMKAMGQQNEDLAAKAKTAYDKGDYPTALRHSINYALNGIPGLGASIDKQSDKFANNDIAGGVGGSLGIGTDLAVMPKIPGAVKATGAAIKRAAEPIAETALGISSKQRMFSKTPGRAALDETTGFTPAAVEKSARARSAALTSDLEAKAAASTVTSTLQHARDVIAARRASALAGNNAGAAAELEPMTAQLTQPQPGFAGAVDPATGQISPDQSASQLLKMKREFGKEHTRWNALKPNGEMGTARQAYHELDKEFDRAVPGGAEQNQTISSLIPVAERSAQNDINASFIQRNAHKMAVHTGAGTAGILVGASHGVLPGIATVVVPEMLASPTVRMGAARGVNAIGKGLSRPGVGRGFQAGSAAGTILRKDDPLGLFQDQQ